jgi:hypothetical protein
MCNQTYFVTLSYEDPELENACNIAQNSSEWGEICNCWTQLEATWRDENFDCYWSNSDVNTRMENYEARCFEEVCVADMYMGENMVSVSCEPQFFFEGRTVCIGETLYQIQTAENGPTDGTTYLTVDSAIPSDVYEMEVTLDVCYVTLSGRVNYAGGVPGKSMVWINDVYGNRVRELSVEDDGSFTSRMKPGEYSVKAWRDGNENGQLETWIGESYAYWGEWIEETQSFATLNLDTDVDNIVVNLVDMDRDNDGYTNWQEYIDWSCHDGSCYGVGQSQMFQSDAEAICQKNNGHLVSIANEAENSLVIFPNQPFFNALQSLC